MAWTLHEAMEYYGGQGAPGDQQALIGLLREAQEESGGTLTRQIVSDIAAYYKIKETLIEAIVRRMPGLNMAGSGHTLEICGGPNCGKNRALAAYCEKKCAGVMGLTLRRAPCMRLCGKGPNVKLDGTLYTGADERLIDRLVSGIR